MTAKQRGARQAEHRPYRKEGRGSRHAFARVARDHDGEGVREWFRVDLDGEFAEGATVRGRITHKGYEHVMLEMLVERIEPERYFSYRWHPNPLDPAVDYSAEPTTLVEFTLEDTDGGTAITIVESGFDRIPLARRAEAFRMNEQGWAGEIKNLAQYVS